MKVHVYVTLKKGVLDPQGEAVGHALQSLEYSSIREVRQGKFFEIELDDSQGSPTQEIRDMCEKLLANTVIEDYRFEIVKGP